MNINERIFDEVTIIDPSPMVLNQEISASHSLFESNCDFVKDALLTYYPESKFTPFDEFREYLDWIDELQDEIIIGYLPKDSWLAEALEVYAESMEISIDDLIQGQVILPYVNNAYIFVCGSDRNPIEDRLLGGDADDGYNTKRFLSFANQ